MKNLSRTFCTIAASTLFAVTAHAEFFDGNKLLTMMNSNDSGDRAMALGYVVGVADAVRGKEFCPTSSEITAGQIRDVVRLYLERYPQVRHFTGDTITMVALGDVWLCAGKKTKPGPNV